MTEGASERYVWACNCVCEDAGGCLACDAYGDHSWALIPERQVGNKAVQIAD